MATHDETPNPIPRRLNEALARVGISQKSLGIRCGIDPSVASARINHYCTGRHVPNFSLLVKVAAVLKVPVAYDHQLGEYYRERLRENHAQRMAAQC